MSDPSLALQKTIRDRLIGWPALVALCPADAVLDRSGRPELSTCILVGEGQTVFAPFESFHATVYSDAHVWVQESGLTGAKAIGSAMQDALKARPWAADGFYVSNLMVTGTRYLRDPAETYSHGIITIQAIVQERPR